jgi:hypothetical protein
MSKRDEQRKQADRDFEEIRQAVAAQSTLWLCDALRDVPHRKWIAVDDGHIAVGIMAHRAAALLAEQDARISNLEKALQRIASPEAFDVSRMMDPERDKELLMRMEFANTSLMETGSHG